MTLKKIDISGTRRGVLANAVSEAMLAQPEDMRFIYDTILKSIANSGDKLLLIPSQANVAIHSLRTCGDGSDDCVRLLDQLSLTRKAYREKYPETAGWCYRIAKGTPFPFAGEGAVAAEDAMLPVRVLFNENDSCGEAVPLADLSVAYSRGGKPGSFLFEKGENIVLGHGDLVRA